MVPTPGARAASEPRKIRISKVPRLRHRFGFPQTSHLASWYVDIPSIMEAALRLDAAFFNRGRPSAGML